MTRTIVYLIRHAAYENPKKIFHGRLPGFPLSHVGKKQANRLAERLGDVPLAAIIASPLQRATETAQIVAIPHGLTIITDDRLLDIQTPLQGRPLAELEAIKFNFFQPKYFSGGGERLSQVFRRIDACIRDYVRQYEGQTIALFSHGDPIMTVVFKYTGRTLYTRRYFDTEYVGVAGGFALRFDNNNTFQSVEARFRESTDQNISVVRCQ